METDILCNIFKKVRARRPLLHHITNYVTVNDCANISLSAGAAPVMAHAKEEVEEMVGHAGALVVNMGTLDIILGESMLLAGDAANRRKIPVIFDPVGVGATRFRTEFASRFLNEVNVAVIKGNAGEIGILAGADASVRGVDSGHVGGDPVIICRNLNSLTGATIVMSGATDIICGGGMTYIVENGDPLMGRISGTGCMAASVIAAFASVHEGYPEASATALAAFGIAGEHAAVRCQGPGSFKPALFDEMAALTPEILAGEARIRQQ